MNNTRKPLKCWNTRDYDTMARMYGYGVLRTSNTHGLFSWKTYSVLRRRPSNLWHSLVLLRKSHGPSLTVWPSSLLVQALLRVPQNSQEMHLDSQCQQSSQSGKWPYYHFIRQGPRLNWPLRGIKSPSIFHILLLLLLSLLRFTLSFFIFQPYFGLGPCLI